MDYHLVEPFRTNLTHIFESIRAGDYDFLCHGNADLDVIEALSKREYRGFHVIRDPRDVIVSGYFSHKFSHPAREDFNPWVLDHRERISSVPQEEGLILEMEFCETIFAAMHSWEYGNPRIYESRFEVLTINPAEEFRKIFEFLGITIPDYGFFCSAGLIADKIKHKLFGHPMGKRKTCPLFFLHRILNANAFENYSGGRKKGEEEVKSHFRKGIAGDWKNYFTPRVKGAFKARYDQLLIDLKYETSLDW
jgi:hypothetical protein